MGKNAIRIKTQKNTQKMRKGPKNAPNNAKKYAKKQLKCGTRKEEDAKVIKKELKKQSQKL